MAHKILPASICLSIGYPIILFYLLFVISGISYGQDRKEAPYLLLQKIGKHKKITFQEGETIRYRLKGEDSYRKGEIVGFGEDEIRFHYFNVRLNEIGIVDISKKSFSEFHLKSGGTKLIFVGAGFFLIDYANQGEIAPSTWIIAGSITATGFLLRLLRKKRFRPGRHYLMNIIDLRDKPFQNSGLKE